MKGDVLSCLCTFLSTKSKFSLYKKITKQRDNNNQEQVKEKHGKVACRQKTLLQCVAGKYLSSCHGTRSQLRILFKQSLSEHAEGDEDTVSLWFPCGPPSQHHTLQTPRPLWERKATKNRWGLGHTLSPSLLESFQALWHPSWQETLHRSAERAFLECQSCSLEKTGNVDLLPQTRRPLYEPGG